MQIYRVDRSKGRLVTRREIPIVRAYRGPNQHGQKVSVANFEEAQNIMRLNNLSLIAADRNGNHQVVGEGYHINAVVHHAQGNMKQARECYLQVVYESNCNPRVNPSSVPGHHHTVVGTWAGTRSIVFWTRANAHALPRL